MSAPTPICAGPSSWAAGQGERLALGDSDPAVCAVSAHLPSHKHAVAYDPGRQVTVFVILVVSPRSLNLVSPQMFVD